MPASIELEPRKKPRQRRSREMTEAILEASVRVLEARGPAGFTTTRVAEVAGVSVGSLYQYFPNKQSLLFCLHAREAEQTWTELAAILGDERRTPEARLKTAVRRFFETEADEAPLRTALQYAELLFWETPEFQAVESRAKQGIRAFLRDAAGVPARSLDFETELVVATVVGMTERVTREPRSPAALRKWSAACSGMLCARLGL